MNSRWETPPEVFEPLNARFKFTLDVCALPENAKCARFYTPLEDGLKQPWTGVCWMNPPYGREIHLWVKKAYEAAQSGATVVALLPARVGPRWWRDWVDGKAEVEIWKGRIRYIGAKDPAPFDNVIAIYWPRVGVEL